MVMSSNTLEIAAGEDELASRGRQSYKYRYYTLDKIQVPLSFLTGVLLGVLLGRSQ